MGLFSSDTDVNYYMPKQVPGTEADWARQLMQMLGQQNINYPLAQTAGMSGNEAASQGILAQILSGGTFEDPSQSQYWQGMRNALKQEEEEGVSSLRRNAQLAGMVRSGPAGRAEGNYRSKMSNQRMSLLGSLYDLERQRDNPYTRLSAGMQYGGLPRMLEQQQMNNQYNQSLQNTLAPYQLQAPLWQQAIGNEMWVNPTVTSSPSMFSQFGPMAGAAIGTMFGGPVGGMAGGALGNLFSNSLSPENKATLKKY